MQRVKAVVFDIDGTVADIEHRRVFVTTKPKNWGAFNARMHLDTRKDDIYAIYKAMRDHYPILFASGRGEEQRDVTTTWLCINGFAFDKLYMRPAKDNRRDDIVKEEILAQMREDGYEPFLVFDDRNQVVDMWRRNGITCCQVAPGDF